MTRQRYLVCYDISDPKRLRQVCKTMESYGDRLQYSVFVCDLSKSELIAMRWAVQDIMHLDLDSVVAVDLGEPSAARFEFLGRARRLPSGGFHIV